MIKQRCRTEQLIPLAFFAILTLIIGYPYFLSGCIPVNADWLVQNFLPWKAIAGLEGIKAQNPDIDDPILQYYPMRMLCSKMLRAGKIPLWNPYILCGAPLLANGISNPLNPFNLFCPVLDFEHLWTLSALAPFFLGGWFAFLLLRSWGIGLIPAMTGGAIYVLNPFFYCRMEYPYIIFAMALFPLAMLFGERFLSKGNFLNLLAAACIMGIINLGGHLQYIIYLLMFIIAWMFISGLFIHEVSAFRAIASGFCIALLGIIIGLPQLLPSMELFINSQRYGVPRYFGEESVPLSSLIVNLLPQFYGFPHKNTYFGIFLFKLSYFNLYNAYVGILSMILIISAVLSSDRPRRLIAFLILGIIPMIVAVVVSANQIQKILTPLLVLISFMDLSRLKAISALCFALCSGLAIDWLHVRLMGKRKAGLTVIISIVFVLSLVSLAMVVKVNERNYLDNSQPNSLSMYLATLSNSLGSLILSIRVYPQLLLALWGIIILLLYSRRLLSGSLATTMIATAIILELLFLHIGYNPFVDKKVIFPTTSLTDKLGEEIGNSRFAALESEFNHFGKGEILPPNTCIAYGLRDIRGWESLYPAIYSRFWEEATGQLSSWARLLDKTPKSLLMQTSTAMIVYPDTIPLASSFQGREEASFDKDSPGKGELAIDGCRIDKLEQLTPMVEFIPRQDYNHSVNNATSVRFNEGMNSLHAMVRTPVAGTLFYRSTFYPGWRAFIDGVENQITRHKYFMSVELEAGSHEVILCFQPFSFRLGVYLFAMMTSLTMIYCFHRLRIS